MSLKTFHIIFVLLTSVVSMFISAWSFVQYFSEERETSDLLMGIGGALAVCVLLVYGRYVLKKLRHIGYL